MNDLIVELAEEYHAGLRGYLDGTGEVGLRIGYELGRKAIQGGIGCLQFLRIHDASLQKIIDRQESGEHVSHVLVAASQFFSEGLSSYEMTNRGFQEATQTLRERNKELGDANEKLAREATERKEAIEALKASERRYRSLVETAPDVIYTLAADGRITSLNKAFESTAGWLRDEWMNKSWAPLVHPDDLPLAVKTFQTVMRGEKPDLIGLRILKRSGGYLFAEFVKIPIIENGEVTGVLGIGRDVTPRKEAEARLRTHERQLAAAQQIAHIGSWEWNSEDGSLTCSEEMFRLLGVAPDTPDPTLNLYLERVHADDRSEVRLAFDAVRSMDKPLIIEHRIVLPDGSVRDIESRLESVPPSTAGELPRVLGTVQDITERKQANEALRTLAQRIVEAQEEERKRIARELHDDVCQRLSATKLHMEALQDRLPNKRSGIAHSLGRLKSQVGSAIREIRSLSANLRPPTLDDLGLLKALNLLCREFEKNYRVKVKYTSAPLPEGSTSPHAQTAIYRIAQEALTNVAKHANARNAVVDIRPTSASILLTIRDNGKGFSTAPTSPRENHTGFGLLSMRERAALIGATFDVQSAPRKGTIIRLEIPSK